MGGMMMSFTMDVTMAPKAAPMMTATARSSTLPFITKSLKSFSIVIRLVLLEYEMGSGALSYSCFREVMALILEYMETGILCLTAAWLPV